MMKWSWIFGPALAGLVLLLPLDLDAQSHRLAALSVLVILWWIFEPIPIAATALLGPTLAIVLGITDAKSAFAPFAHPLIFLFMGGFMIARAMEVHGLSTRIALHILTRPYVKGDPVRSVIALVLVSAGLSMWLSNTATTAMLLPISLGILKSIFKNDGRAQKSQILMGTAYASSIGGILTPVGSPPNLIAIGMLEKVAHYDVSFFQWMLLALPVGVLALLFLIGRLIQYTTSMSGESRMEFLTREYQELGRMSSGEKNATFTGLFAAFLWVLPGFLSLILPAQDPLLVFFSKQLTESTVALLAASLLFILPTRGKRPTITWDEAAQIDWGVLILFGGGLSMGSMLFDTGLANTLGSHFVGLTGGNLWLFLVIAIFFAIFFTEVTSNTAAANMLVPLVLAASLESGFHPFLPTAGVAIACSMAFMFPIATPPNAIVYGSGFIRIREMAKLGLQFNLVCGTLLLLVLYIASFLFVG